MRLSIPQSFGDHITGGFFGGNFLANRDQIGEDGTTDELIAELGVTSLRYPGGSLTEHYFDISNPDQDMIVTLDGATSHFVPMSDFLAYAAENDLPVTIVLPTQKSLGTSTDGNGDRSPAIDEAELRTFIRDTATGKYGDAKIQAFEIGNEYWGSGQMSAVEYGRLSSEMAEIIDDELGLVADATGEEPNIQIVVQAGTNNNYSNLRDDYDPADPVQDILDDLNAKYGMDFGDDVLSGTGDINWRLVNDKLIQNEFDSDELDSVDAVNTHLYSQSQAVDGHRDFALKQVEESWTELVEDIDIYVTEWNSSASSPLLDEDEDFGLHQAHELLNILETMADSSVDQAHVWPLLQNTKNALSVGMEHSELSPAGEMFAMMAETLPGKKKLDFVPEDDNTTEFSGEHADVHAFYGCSEVVIYVASDADTTETTHLDLSQLIASGGTVSAQILGVAPGENPGSTEAKAEIEELDPADFYEDGIVTALLDEGEIMEFTIRDFVPTNDFARVMAEIDRDALEDGHDCEDLFLPTTAFEESSDPEEEEDYDDDGGDGGGAGAMLGMLGLIPGLLLIGLIAV